MHECLPSPWLSAFIDGELPPVGMRQVEMHLRDCQACAAQVAALRALGQRLRAMPRPRLSPTAMGELCRPAAWRREQVIYRLAGGWAAAAAALLVASTLFLAMRSAGAIDNTTTTAPTWEMAVLDVFGDAAALDGVEAQLAQWIVHDLSREIVQ